MLSKDELEQTIIKILLDHPEGVQIGYILSVLQRARKDGLDARYRETLRKRVYRLLEKWAKFGIVEAIKIGRHYKIYRLVCAKHVIDWIRKAGQSKIQTQTEDFIKMLDKIDPNNVTGRLKVLALLYRTAFPISDELKETIEDEFLCYVDDTNDKRLLFVRKDLSLKEADLSDILVLRYLHRFNNPKYWQRYNAEVKRIFKETAKRYRWAIHLTLTIDPKQFDNLIELFLEARRQINSLLTNLRNQHKKKKGTKLEYVRFNEFTENGLLHFHIILFGRRYIKPVKQIAESMWKLGFVWAYQLTVRNGKWVYPRKKPHDYYEKLRKKKQGNTDTLPDGAGFMQNSAGAYFYFAYPKMKKKSGSGEDEDEDEGVMTSSDYDNLDNYYRLNMALLWAFNMRTKTQSRDLIPGNPRENQEPIWDFVGSYYKWDLEDKLSFLGFHPNEIWYLINPEPNFEDKGDPPPTS